MDILNTVSLEINGQIRINFDGGDLSSDAGLLLFKEFLYKIGAVKLIHRMFKSNDTAGLPNRMSFMLFTTFTFTHLPEAALRHSDC